MARNHFTSQCRSLSSAHHHWFRFWPPPPPPKKKKKKKCLRRSHSSQTELRLLAHSLSLTCSCWPPCSPVSPPRQPPSCSLSLSSSSSSSSSSWLEHCGEVVMQQHHRSLPPIAAHHRCGAHHRRMAPSHVDGVHRLATALHGARATLPRHAPAPPPDHRHHTHTTIFLSPPPPPMMMMPIAASLAAIAVAHRPYELLHSATSVHGGCCCRWTPWRSARHFISRVIDEAG